MEMVLYFLTIHGMNREQNALVLLKKSNELPIYTTGAISISRYLLVKKGATSSLASSILRGFGNMHIDLNRREAVVEVNIRIFIFGCYR